MHSLFLQSHVFYSYHEKNLFLNVRLRNYCYCYYYYSSCTSTANDFLFKSIIMSFTAYIDIEQQKKKTIPTGNIPVVEFLCSTYQSFIIKSYKKNYIKKCKLSRDTLFYYKSTSGRIETNLSTTLAQLTHDFYITR